MAAETCLRPGIALPSPPFLISETGGLALAGESLAGLPIATNTHDQAHWRLNPSERPGEAGNGWMQSQQAAQRHGWVLWAEGL